MNVRLKIKNLLFRVRKRLLGFPIVCRPIAVKYRQDALAQCRAGDLLQIVHAESKVFVYSIELNALLGEIERSLSKKLIKLFGKGFCLDGKILSRTGGLPYPYFGLVIAIYDTKTYLAHVENFNALRE